MAFTLRESLRGGFSAWLIFLVLLVAGLAVWCGANDALSGTSSFTWYPLFVFFSLFIGAPVSLSLMPLGVAVARPIAHLLRRTTAMSLHAAVYSALGGAVGLGFVALMRGAQLWAPLAFSDGLAVVPAAAVTVAVPLGWWRTVRLARLDDIGVRIRGRKGAGDPDADYEDNLL